jgi:hypothetical protein
MEKGDCCGADWGTWIEIGWTEFASNCGGGSTHWCYFVEKGVDFTTTQRTDISTSVPNFGTFDQYRITNRPTNPNGSTDWWMQIDPNVDGSFSTLETYNTQWHRGVAFGESVKIGSNTGMQDDQQALQYKNNNDAWNPWPDVDCRVDTASGWSWHRNSSNSYTVTQPNNAC